ncbi:hypothetical protein BpHYR1_011056 [Brachionus plicatilis]|uniref:Uncharacterized protein n=1 Tax=Brachionus plicatilis TaxID=10195 RepID=A0A3M7PN71_BRAPC|nr:hypothetical protein BpHYR1_011056 [Brachionus plicatilis]
MYASPLDQFDKSGRFDKQTVRVVTRVGIGLFEHDGVGRVGLVEYVAGRRNGQRVVLLVLVGHVSEEAVYFELVERVAQHGHPRVLVAGRLRNKQHKLVLALVRRLAYTGHGRLGRHMQLEAIFVIAVPQHILVQLNRLLEPVGPGRRAQIGRQQRTGLMLLGQYQQTVEQIHIPLGHSELGLGAHVTPQVTALLYRLACLAYLNAALVQIGKAKIGTRQRGRLGHTRALSGRHYLVYVSGQLERVHRAVYLSPLFVVEQTNVVGESGRFASGHGAHTGLTDAHTGAGRLVSMGRFFELTKSLSFNENTAGFRVSSVSPRNARSSSLNDNCWSTPIVSFRYKKPEQQLGQQVLADLEEAGRAQIQLFAEGGLGKQFLHAGAERRVVGDSVGERFVDVELGAFGQLPELVSDEQRLIEALVLLSGSLLRGDGVVEQLAESERAVVHVVYVAEYGLDGLVVGSVLHEQMHEYVTQYFQVVIDSGHMVDESLVHSSGLDVEMVESLERARPGSDTMDMVEWRIRDRLGKKKLGPAGPNGPSTYATWLKSSSSSSSNSSLMSLDSESSNIKSLLCGVDVEKNSFFNLESPSIDIFTSLLLIMYWFKCLE